VPGRRETETLEEQVDGPAGKQVGITEALVHDTAWTAFRVDVVYEVLRMLHDNPEGFVAVTPDDFFMRAQRNVEQRRAEIQARAEQAEQIRIAQGGGEN
jgi:hypothetical protein